MKKFTITRYIYITILLLFLFVNCTDNDDPNIALNESQAGDLLVMLLSAFQQDPVYIWDGIDRVEYGSKPNPDFGLNWFYNPSQEEDGTWSMLFGMGQMDYYANPPTLSDGYVVSAFDATLDDQEQLYYKADYYFYDLGRDEITVPEEDDNTGSTSISLNDESTNDSLGLSYTVSSILDSNDEAIPLIAEYYGTPSNQDTAFNYTVSGKLLLEGDIQGEVFIDIFESYSSASILQATIGTIYFANFYG